jgi:hypothetical protein
MGSFYVKNPSLKLKTTKLNHKRTQMAKRKSPGEGKTGEGKNQFMDDLKSVQTSTAINVAPLLVGQLPKRFRAQLQQTVWNSLYDAAKQMTEEERKEFQSHYFHPVHVQGHAWRGFYTQGIFWDDHVCVQKFRSSDSRYKGYESVWLGRGGRVGGAKLPSFLKCETKDDFDTLATLGWDWESTTGFAGIHSVLRNTPASSLRPEVDLLDVYEIVKEIECVRSWILIYVNPNLSLHPKCRILPIHFSCCPKRKSR